MIVMHFSMQREDIIDLTNGKCHMYTFYMQEEDILEQNIANFHLWIL